MLIGVYILIGVVAILALAALILGDLTKSPKFKGDVGEWFVKKSLGENVVGKQYVINDIIIDNGDRTCQIDHIVISKCGIFVIETKNYSGIIYGEERSNKWTQVLGYGKVKNQFYNPIKQNNTHIYALNKLFNRKIVFYNVVVFFRNSLTKLKINNVIELSQLNSYLRQKMDSEPEIYSENEIEQIYNTILNSRNMQVNNKEHVQNIETMKQNIKANICPRCGGSLVLRKGKNNEFYGCSNYPNCKFTKTKE